MPSPIGHALGGVLCALAVAPPEADRGRHDWRRLLQDPFVRAGVIAAVLPDVDFLWGGHNMHTHSLGAALLAGLAVLVATRGRGVRLALVVALAWASHVLFDWLGSDDTPPLGVMALWPLTSAFYFAHAYVFEAISRRYWLSNFWPHNLWAVGTEVAMLLPPVAVLAWWKRRVEGRGRDGASPPSSG